MRLRIGCSSWTSPAWSGRFYPSDLADGERLGFYARFFDCVEVDSTYYAAPNPHVVRAWERKTPDGFLFALKVPRDLLDPKKPPPEKALGEFVETAQLLERKLGPILLQLPPWFKPSKTIGAGTSAFLTNVLGHLPPGPRYSVELRDAGWFHGEAGDLVASELRRRGMALCWSVLNYVDVPPVRTVDWTYVRFIGDHRSIPAERHGEIRADRTEVTRTWAHRITMADLVEADVFFNNHFAGYAPDSANLLRTELGLPKIDLPVGPTARGLETFDRRPP